MPRNVLQVLRAKAAGKVAAFMWCRADAGGRPALVT